MNRCYFRVWSAVVCLVGNLWAEDINVSSEDGMDLILHEDFSWEPVETGGWVPPGVFEVTLDDGRTLVLHNDFTWRFSSASVAEGVMPLQTAYAVGKARRETAEAAREDADKEAVRRLAIQLKSLAPGTELGSLTECIAQHDKTVDISEHSRSGWDVTVRIEVDHETIRTILDCVDPGTRKRNSLADEPR